LKASLHVSALHVHNFSIRLVDELVDYIFELDNNSNIASLEFKRFVELDLLDFIGYIFFGRTLSGFRQDELDSSLVLVLREFRVFHNFLKQLATSTMRSNVSVFRYIATAFETNTRANNFEGSAAFVSVGALDHIL